MKFTGNGIQARIQNVEAATPSPVVVMSLHGVDPAEVVVAAADVGKFQAGDQVTIIGSPAAAIEADGVHTIGSVVTGTGTLTLTGVDGSSWVGSPFTSPPGMTITPEPAAGLAVDIVAMSNAAPAVVTVDAGDIALFIAGNLVSVAGTGVQAIDGKTFAIAAVGATTFSLKGSDTSGNTSTINVGTVTPIHPNDMLLFCLTSFERAVKAADAIDTTTFCGPESLAGQPTPGEIKVVGFVNYDESAYLEFMEGVKDGVSRAFSITLPAKVGGTIIYQLTPTGFTETFQVNEAAGFEGTAVLNSDPIYLVGANK